MAAITQQKDHQFKMQQKIQEITKQAQVMRKCIKGCKNTNRWCNR